MKTGKDGGEKHQAMIATIPEIVGRLQRNLPGFGFYGTTQDVLTLAWTGWTNTVDGRKYPDGVIAWYGGGYALIECGVCNPDKWPGHPWIHWGFDGTVTVINDDGNPMLPTVVEYIANAEAHGRRSRTVQPIVGSLDGDK